MPSVRTPTKGARASAKAAPPPRSRFAGALGRFGSGQRATVNRRTNSLGTLLRDVRNEVRKVEWPTREEATKLTAAVVGLSAVVGVFLGGVDFIFQELFKLLIGLPFGGV
jgi:preprotein translocase subunit SecE